MTSYVETHAQISSVVGGPISFGWVKRRLLAAWHRLCARCGEGCVSGGSVLQDDGVRYIAHPCSVQMGESPVTPPTPAPSRWVSRLLYRPPLLRPDG